MAASTIIIVGAGGRLGQALDRAIAADESDCSVIPLTRAEADLSVANSIGEALGGRDFDLLLMAAAMTDVDGCEREPARAQRLNAEVPGECARLCAERGARMIHFSTDYVFNGEKQAPYDEDDLPDPRSVYGRTKLAGEQAVAAASPDHLVVRLSWLFGPGGENATPDWVIPAAMSGRPLRIVADKTGSPSYSVDIAAAMMDLLFDARARGVLHLCNEGACTWIDWARECLEAAHAEGLLDEVPPIEPWTLDECFDGKAVRPRHSAMSNDRYRGLTGKCPRSWQEGVRAYVADVLRPRLLAGK